MQEALPNRSASRYNLDVSRIPKLAEHEAAVQIAHILDNFDWEEVLRIMKVAKLPWFENQQEVKTPSLEHVRKLCENLLAQVSDEGGEETYGYFRARLLGGTLELEFVIESFSGVPEVMFDERLPSVKARILEEN